MISIRCTVRGCDLPLDLRGSTWSCNGGHAFDIGRSGYANLLQPQDRRSADPGDSPARVQARMRWLDRGFADPLFALVEAWVDDLAPPRGGALLDVGCGDGRLLARLAARNGLDPCGVDLSVAAIRVAARRSGAGTWLVVNADRRLPFPDSSFVLILSIFGRRNGAELARVLSPGGSLIVAVPAADDLVELRAAVLGEGRPVHRVERTIAELCPPFTPARVQAVRHRVSLDAAAIRDALMMSYRGARASESDRARSLTALDVTLAADVLLLGVRSHI